jgi:hypothetical protein
MQRFKIVVILCGMPGADVPSDTIKIKEALWIDLASRNTSAARNYAIKAAQTERLLFITAGAVLSQDCTYWHSAADGMVLGWLGPNDPRQFFADGGKRTTSVRWGAGIPVNMSVPTSEARRLGGFWEMLTDLTGAGQHFTRRFLDTKYPCWMERGAEADLGNMVSNFYDMSRWQWKAITQAPSPAQLEPIPC